MNQLVLILIALMTLLEDLMIHLAKLMRYQLLMKRLHLVLLLMSLTRKNLSLLLLRKAQKLLHVKMDLMRQLTLMLIDLR